MTWKGESMNLSYLHIFGDSYESEVYPQVREPGELHRDVGRDLGEWQELVRDQ